MRTITSTNVPIAGILSGCPTANKGDGYGGKAVKLFPSDREHRKFMARQRELNKALDTLEAKTTRLEQLNRELMLLMGSMSSDLHRQRAAINFLMTPRRNK